MNDMLPRQEDVHLVSPWAPSGVAWLLNALLELGVPIFRDVTRPTWLASGSRFRLSPHEDDLKRHLPSLSSDDGFAFRTELRVRWSHEWPIGTNQSAPIILLVRDPADALVSLHRRFHEGLPIGRFLTEPSKPMYAPADFLPGLARADEWALFVMLWQQTMADRVLLIRFEELKTEPLRELRRIARHLGLDATDRDLVWAAEQSSFERARAAEDRFIAERPTMNKYRANHSGKLGESRSVLAIEDWQCLAGLPAKALASLGYQPRPELSASALPFNLNLADAGRAWLAQHTDRDPKGFVDRVARSACELASLGVSTASIDRLLAASLWSEQLTARADVSARRRLWLAMIGLVNLLSASPTAERAIATAADVCRQREPIASNATADRLGSSPTRPAFVS